MANLLTGAEQPTAFSTNHLTNIDKKNIKPQPTTTQTRKPSYLSLTNQRDAV